MARHHDREWVACQCLSDVAGQSWITQAPGDLPIRDGFADGNRPRNRVHLLIERRHARHVQLNTGQVTELAIQQRHNFSYRATNLGRRRRFDAAGEAPLQPPAGRRDVWLGQLHARYAALAPGDARATEWRLEKSEVVWHLRSSCETRTRASRLQMRFRAEPDALDPESGLPDRLRPVRAAAAGSTEYCCLTDRGMMNRSHRAALPASRRTRRRVL